MKTKKYKLFIKVGNCEVEDPEIRLRHIKNIECTDEDLEETLYDALCNYIDCDYFGYELEEIVD